MRKKLLFTFVATLLVLTDSNSQVTDYVSGLNSPTKMTLDGTTIYVNGWEDIYAIDTSAGSPSANLIYTLPSDFYCYKTQKLGDYLFILVEHYIESTDEAFGSRILKLDLTNTEAGTQVIVNSINFISSFVLVGNTIYYSEEQETTPDSYTTDIYSFDATQGSPTPILENSDIGLNNVVVDDMEVYNNTLYMSTRDYGIKSLDLSSGASTLEDYVIGLNSNKGTFLSQNNELYICNAHQIEKIDITDSNPSLQFIGENTTYEDMYEGEPYYANFRDVILIGNTLYMTLEEQGKVVTLTDETLSNDNFLANRNSMKVYPNPVKDILHVNIPNEVIKSVELYNLNGQKLNTFDFGFEHLSVGHLSEGLYIFKVSTVEGKTQILKFVKQ
jgi:hypothetical protein